MERFVGLTVTNITKAQLIGLAAYAGLAVACVLFARGSLPISTDEFYYLIWIVACLVVAYQVFAWKEARRNKSR